MPEMLHRRSLPALLPLALALSPSSTATGQSSPSFAPLLYHDAGPNAGRLAANRHRYWEDVANTVFVLPYDFATLPPSAQQPTPRIDALHCNFAHFWPPEGQPATTRRLLSDSVAIGLQLYVNYSGSRIEPSDPSQTYMEGTFFIDVVPAFNTQVPSVVPASGFANVPISATRAAVGTVSGRPALYVTASIRYGISDIDASDQALAEIAQRDRLFVRNVAGVWEDRSQLVPLGVRNGNSSGVVWADFDRDGDQDLYVGKCGDNFGGAHDKLCFFNGSAFVDVTATKILGSVANATNDVAAADIDQDGDVDVVSVGRLPDGGSAVAGADLVLINQGGVLTATQLPNGASTDSRSVALGNIDQAGTLEIAIGNGTRDEFVTGPLGASPPQLFQKSGTGWTDVASQLLPPAAMTGTTWTQQVLLKDICSPIAGQPSAVALTTDGWLDLVMVNWRDHMLATPNEPGANLRILANTPYPQSGQPRFANCQTAPTIRGRCVALSDFMSGLGGDGLDDVMIGCGSRYHGQRTHLLRNIGSTTGGWAADVDFDPTYDLIPGTEHAYGFDFADLNGDGDLDALQCARSYSYLMPDLLNPQGHWLSPHTDFTQAGSPNAMSNARGRLNPRVAEDGVFADFDADGDLDAIVVGGAFSSPTTPTSYPGSAKECPETIVLMGSAGNQFTTAWHPVPTVPSTSHFYVDDLVDINMRDGEPGSRFGDRVVAADMDNDGYTDAIVQLFGAGPFPIQPLDNSAVFTLSMDRYAAGWRYLRNRRGDNGWSPGGYLFEDVAATRFKDPVTNGFSGFWNRHLGSMQVADFDNNGRLDILSTFGMAGKAGTGAGCLVANTAQTHDLLFLNGDAPAAPGTLFDRTATHLPAQVLPFVSSNFTVGASLFDYPGAPGTAAGDIDNDGDADALIFRGTALIATAFPSLLINGGTGSFTEQFLARMRPQFFDTALFQSVLLGSPVKDLESRYPAGGLPNMVVDVANQGAIGDLDGDGDQDIVWHASLQTLRILRNDGTDANADGWINRNDAVQQGLGLGYFTDVTSTWLADGLELSAWESTDFALIDLDNDGDLDIATDQYQNPMILWRNNSTNPDARPRVAEIWPRVGARRNQQITLKGNYLDHVNRVEFRTKSGTVEGTGIILNGPNELKVTIPAGCPLGLAQIRVRRAPPQAPVVLSTQYKGYFIQG